MLTLFKNDLAHELLKCLEQIQYGSIEIVLTSNEVKKITGLSAGPDCRIQVLNDNFFYSLLEKGDIGLGESYIEGHWETDDISQVIEFGIKNKSALSKAIYGQLTSLFYYKIKHYFKRNSKTGSKKNISYHYDLGNNFYSLWLDPTMTYSSAYWGDDKSLTLSQAQEKKYQTILDQIKPRPGARILEIGCGWGGFAEYAAKKGYHVTGLTLSQEQLRYAKERLERQNLQTQTELLLRDYRDHTGTYDHVVSIEMIEAVGESYWDSYFDKIKSFLTGGGSLAIQSILIDQQSFATYRKGTDFIQQYIFPGGMLPSLNILKDKISSRGGQKIEVLSFGLDYARTLKLWDDAFIEKAQTYSEQGFDKNFIRMWHFYLNYCEGAFKSGQTDVVIVSAKL